MAERRKQVELLVEGANHPFHKKERTAGEVLGFELGENLKDRGPRVTANNHHRNEIWTVLIRIANERQGYLRNQGLGGNKEEVDFPKKRKEAFA